VNEERSSSQDEKKHFSFSFNMDEILVTLSFKITNDKISITMTDELIKSWIGRDLGEDKYQPAYRILRGRLSRKTYLLFRFSIILRYFLRGEKSKHGPSLEFLEIKGVDRPMQGLS